MFKNSIIFKWFIFGLIIVSLRIIISFAFSNKIMLIDCLEEYIIGVGVVLVFGVYYELKSRKN